MHSNLPSKKKCTEAKANANDLNDFTTRDKVLELFEPAVASLAGLSDNDIDIVKDNLSKNHDEILEVEVQEDKPHVNDGMWRGT